MNEAAMTFDNPQTPRSELPDFRSIEFEPVASNFRVYTVMSTSIHALPVLLVGSALNLLPKVTLMPGLLTPMVVFVIAALTGLYRWVDAGHRGWALRAHDLAAREGIFWRSVTVLPFARIQHVETSSGPLERWRGMARLKLYTAGGMTADLTLIGLDSATADSLREHLAEQIRLRDAQAPDAEEDGARDDRRDA